VDILYKNTVYFVGAGPGDPELLTIKARKLLLNADLVVYTGSLIPKEVVAGLRARVIDSSNLTLDQLIEIMGTNARAGRLVVRLHTGDPSLYSAIQEQIFELERQGINCIVIPGVSSGFAAAASLGLELTIPGISQTVIISRISGRTKVPETQRLSYLAKTKATLLLYLSVFHIKRVVKELLDGGLEENTPVVVAEKVTWPQERIISGTLKDIAQKVEQAGIKKTAIVMVGEVLRAYKKGNFERSKLYSRDFSHGYRASDSYQSKDEGVGSIGSIVSQSFDDTSEKRLLNTEPIQVLKEYEEVAKQDKEKEKRLDKESFVLEQNLKDFEEEKLEELSGKQDNYFDIAEYRSGSYMHSKEQKEELSLFHKELGISKIFPNSIIIFYVTRSGRYLAERLCAFFPKAQILPYSSIKKDNILKRYWQKGRGFIFIMAAGIVVRTISPYLKGKDVDPAVVVMDEAGCHIISLVSGHLGGANALTSYISKMIGAKPVITTASDVQGLVPFDIWVFEKGLIPESKDSLKRAQAKLVETGSLNIFSDISISNLPKGLNEVKDIAYADVVITYKSNISGPKIILKLFPRLLCLGVGCHRGINSNVLIEKAILFFKDHGFCMPSVFSIATIDVKKDEKAIIDLARYLDVPLKFFSASQLNEIPVSCGSDIVVKAVGARAVCEPAAILGAKDGGYEAQLLIPKEKRGEVTFALAKRDLTL